MPPIDLNIAARIACRDWPFGAALMQRHGWLTVSTCRRKSPSSRALWPSEFTSEGGRVHAAGRRKKKDVAGIGDTDSNCLNNGALISANSEFVLAKSVFSGKYLPCDREQSLRVPQGLPNLLLNQFASISDELGKS